MGIRSHATQMALLGLLAAGLLSCNGYDPVPQEKIDALPAESGSPSPAHRSGQPCVLCHSTYGGATPVLEIAGTVFKQDPMTGDILTATNVKVTINDSAGRQSFACSNLGGNFYIEKGKGAELTFPLKVLAGAQPMSSIIGREGSCAGCHKLPEKGAADKLGKTYESPGIIVVDPADENDPDCGGSL